MAVRTSRRPTRSKSLKPNSCSRSLICRERADWLMCRRNAAFETVPRSATATNVRRRLRSMSLFISNLHKKTEELCIGRHIDLGIYFAQISVKTCQQGQVDPSVTVLAITADTNGITP